MRISEEPETTNTSLRSAHADAATGGGTAPAYRDGEWRISVFSARRGVEELRQCGTR